MYRRSVYYLTLVFLLFPFSLFSGNKIYLKDIRPPFFILNTSGKTDLIIGDNVYYSPKGEKLGKFSVLKKAGDKILCKEKDDFGKVHKGCYVKGKGWSSKTVLIKSVKDQVRNNIKDKTVNSKKISGIKFIETEKGVFITLNPLPLTIIPDRSFKGIDRFLELLKEKSGMKCVVELMTEEEIKKYLKSGDEKLLFGKRGKEPKLMFFSDSGVRENPVSEKIIGKLKYKIFVPVKLIIL